MPLLRKVEKMKKLFTINNVLYALSILFAFGVLMKTYLDRLKLPKGACPIDNNRSLLMLAIAVLVVVTIIISYLDWRKKRQLGRRD